MQMRSYSEVEYVNLTEICERHKKYIYHYKENKQTNDFLKPVSSETNILIEELIIFKKEEFSGQSYYFGHPTIGHHLTEWCKKERKLQREEEIKTRLQKELGGEIEVPTNTGAIDLLTEKEIIEVKSVKNWIHGVGQLMVRGQDYPKHSKRLHLFGKFSTKSRITQYLQIKSPKLIQKYCVPLDIKVTWEE
ncbi:KilA-N domain-containing protein [Nostoc sp.]